MVIFFIIDTKEELNKYTHLFNKYKGLIYSVSKIYLERIELAEENLQDVMLYIAENFEKIGDVDSKQTKGLVILISVSKAKNTYKYNLRHNPDSINYCSLDDVLELVDDREFDDSDVVLLSSLIDELPDVYKIPLFFKYVYDYKSKEIAQILGVSDALVRKRIQLAKKQLKEKVTGD